MVGDSGQTGPLRSRVSRRDVKGRRLYSALDSKVKPSKAPQSLCICICICENALCSEFQSEALQAPALSKFFALLIFHRAQYPFERSWSLFPPIQHIAVCWVVFCSNAVLQLYCVLCWEWCLCYLSRIVVWYCVLLGGWLQYCRV